MIILEVVAFTFSGVQDVGSVSDSAVVFRFLRFGYFLFSCFTLSFF